MNFYKHFNELPRVLFFATHLVTFGASAVASFALYGVAGEVTTATLVMLTLAILNLPLLVLSANSLKVEEPAQIGLGYGAGFDTGYASSAYSLAPPVSMSGSAHHGNFSSTQHGARAATLGGTVIEASQINL